MQFSRTVVKSFNPELLHQQCSPLGIQAISFIGFVLVSTRQVNPAPARQQYGELVVDGVRQALQANPGEMLFEAPSDPGAALDTVLTNHVHTNDSTLQAKGKARAADKALVSDALTRPVLTNPEIQAVARIVVNKY